MSTMQHLPFAAHLQTRSLFSIFAHSHHDPHYSSLSTSDKLVEEHKIWYFSRPATVNVSFSEKQILR